MLDATTNVYKETGKGLSKAAMDQLLLGLKKEYEWLGLAYSQVLQRVTFNLSSAFVNFFEGRTKFPNFKSKHGKQSIQSPQNVKLIPEDSVIKFPGNLGLMKTVFHKELPDAKFTSVTISRNSEGKYYASILFNQNDHPVVAIRGAIGVDLGLKNFAITSEGSKYDIPKKQLDKLEKNRKYQQKKLAKKTDKTYNKRRKAKLLVAKVSSKIARVREDFLHKLSRQIAYENQVICVEDLAVKNRVKNPIVLLFSESDRRGISASRLTNRGDKL